MPTSDIRKKETGKKRKNTGEPARQRERRREKEKERERVNVGVHMILCKENQLSPLLLLLLLFVNQIRLVILIILVDCCPQNLPQHSPAPPHEPALSCRNLPQRHF